MLEIIYKFMYVLWNHVFSRGNEKSIELMRHGFVTLACRRTVFVTKVEKPQLRVVNYELLASIWKTLTFLQLLVDWALFSKVRRSRSGLEKGPKCHRPIIVGSSAMASSSVAALSPFLLREYHKNDAAANKFVRTTNQAKTKLTW